jgi:RHS repeat-associated protein
MPEATSRTSTVVPWWPSAPPARAARGRNDGSFQYAWDAANRLISVTKLSTGHVTSFKYDGLGRRLAIDEQDAGAQPTETRYLWCGNTLCGARDSSNNVNADYYPQGELHASQALYYVKDQIGTVLGVMNARGALLGQAAYSAYGVATLTTGTTADFGYAGMLYNPATGLYLTKYREYSPAVGRWLSRDPAGESAGINLYAYVGGNPVSYVDPYGLWRLPDFVTFQINLYVGSVAGTFSRSGNSFITLGGLRAYPNPLSVEASVSAGYLNTCDANATPENVDKFLSGFSGGGAAAYAGVGGGLLFSPGNGSATVFGFGAGTAYGSSSVGGGGAIGGFSINQGQTGLGW